jgi:predicted Zn finger-like uncharacterized protein
MPIVCPNCATSYGVEMASLRPAAGRTRQLRCQHCRWVWQAQLSDADKLLVAADAVPPVRRAMLAAAQAAAEPIREPMRSRLPPRRATTLLAEELEARFPAKQGPIAPAALQTETSKPVAMAWTQLVEAIAALVGSGLARLRRLPLSRLQCVILSLAFVDAGIIGWRADLVWAMPQTASFYAGLGLPVNLRGMHFDRLTATAERHDGEPVLIVKGEIRNSTRKTEDVPRLRFAVRDAKGLEIYSWIAAPARERVSAGGWLAFQSELALPPPDTREIVVRFIDRDNTF